MDELNELLTPLWGAEKWILEGWNKINQEEKVLIKSRLDDLFKDGLPFEIKTDKLLYIYTFSLLAQLEVLAIQVPLKFEDKMSTPLFKQQMRQQLLDEIFHGLVFTKIVYMLCAPYRSPPTYNKNIELLCDYIRNEDCPKIGVVMLNLVAEGWIEEVFNSLYQQNIAPNVFAAILEDEHRHVCEADLYREVGLPNKAIMRKKLNELEDKLLTNILSQPKYILALSELLGTPATQALIQSMHEKHTKQLKKINMIPSEQWRFMMQMSQNFFEKLHAYSQYNTEIEMTPTRKFFMTQWGAPGNPTMNGQFDLDVSCLGFFEKKFPPETLTTLMMQATSQVLTEDSSFRMFLSNNKMYQSDQVYLAIVVKLPDCNGHVGNILFKDCHEMTVLEVASKIRRVIQMMAYCYKKREQMEAKYPALKRNLDKVLYDYAHDAYPYPIPGAPVVSLSNIGMCGYSQAISPLRKQEGLKLTLMTVERKLVWSHLSNSFEPKDMLPVSVSADHRIFDGDIAVPKLINGAFKQVFQSMLQGLPQSTQAATWSPNVLFGALIDKLLATNVTLGYQTLVGLQTVWPEFMDIEDIFSIRATKKLVRTKLETWMG